MPGRKGRAMPKLPPCVPDDCLADGIDWSEPTIAEPARNAAPHSDAYHIAGQRRLKPYRDGRASHKRQRPPSSRQRRGR